MACGNSENAPAPSQSTVFEDSFKIRGLVGQCNFATGGDAPLSRNGVREQRRIPIVARFAAAGADEVRALHFAWRERPPDSALHNFGIIRLAQNPRRVPRPALRRQCERRPTIDRRSRLRVLP